jgi:hypothetical protein
MAVCLCLALLGFGKITVCPSPVRPHEVKRVQRPLFILSPENLQKNPDIQIEKGNVLPINEAGLAP